MSRSIGSLEEVLLALERLLWLSAMVEKESNCVGLDNLLNTIGDILVYGNSKAIALFVLLDFVRVVHKKQSVLLSGLSGIGSK